MQPTEVHGLPRIVVGPGPGLMTIGTLSQATGIPVPTLRTWERRYGQPEPLRRPSGHRLYPATAVPRLQQVALLLRQGHRAATLLALAESQLEALTHATEVVREHSPGTEVSQMPGMPGVAERGIDVLLRALLRLDRGALLGELRLEWARLGPLRFLTEVAGPFMAAVGEGWHSGELEIRHEHFAAACVDGLLKELRDPYDHTSAGPRVVMATLPADQHEGGLLMAALVIAVRGRQVLYIGADTPLTETARAAEMPRVEAVAISISAAFERAQAERRLGELRALLPARIALWVGGAGVPGTIAGVEQFEDLYALDRRLGATR